MRRLSVTRVGPHTSEQRRREAAGVPLGQEVEMHAAGPNLVRGGRIFTVLDCVYVINHCSYIMRSLLLGFVDI